MFKKIRFYKTLLIEIVETLCSICLYLESDSRRGAHNPHGVHMRSHFDALKSFSEDMRGSKSHRKVIDPRSEQEALHVIHDRTTKSESNTLDAYLARQLEDPEFRAAYETAQKEVREEYYQTTGDYYGGER